jgi:hypothetical protein
MLLLSSLSKDDLDSAFPLGPVLDKVLVPA